MLAVWDSKAEANFKTDFDCFIAQALLLEGRPVGSYEQTLSAYHVSSIEELARKQQERLQELPQLSSLFYDIEMPLARILWKMEQKGILLDTQALTNVGNDIDHLLESTQAEIAKETGGGISINSPIQLGSFLVEKMGIPLGKTKTGRYATNEGELTLFAHQFPIIAHILTYRELIKLRSTYVESLIQKVDATSRVHTTYNQVYVNTGRLSSSNPNLQNIPVSSVIGKEIKSCFIASPGHVLVSFDYSQQELRILAHLAKEKALIHAFENNQDVHTLTASKLFSVPYNEVSQQQRTIGKTINFGIIYGMSSFGMSDSLHIPQEDAESFLQQFYMSYPQIKTYYDTYLTHARIDGVVQTLLGRRRYVFDYPTQHSIDNGTRRILMNYPIQGSAADLMKKAMVDIEKNILVPFPTVSLLLQIHDDLVFEIPDTDPLFLREIIRKIQQVLCSVYPLAVPLVVDIKMGHKWGHMNEWMGSKEDI